MRNTPKIGAALMLPGIVLSAGCGLEALFAEATDTDHIRPRTSLLGTVPVDGFPLDTASFEVLAADGTEIELFRVEIEGNRFELSLAEGRYPNARLNVSTGNRNLLAFLPEIGNVSAKNEFDAQRGLVPTTVNVSVDSTAAALALVARVTSLGRDLLTLDPDTSERTLTAIVEGLETSTSSLAVFQDVVSDLYNESDFEVLTSTVVFQWPDFNPVDEAGNPTVSCIVDESPVLEESRQVGNFPSSSGPVLAIRVDQWLRQAIADLRIQECLDPVLVKVVLEVDFRAGQLSGLCAEINRGKWVSGLNTQGKQMYFVGGIHEESPIQDTAIDAMLGNQGSWTPNTIPMFDDGSNGDAESGDGIWTISFDLPRGLRIGYKYTWGFAGDLWTGTEEWPGNQRLLEVVDVNDDGFVYRQDNFGDEATNKDLSNQRANIRGVVTWTTDGDGDGIPDPRERHVIDSEDGCTPDAVLKTPTGIGPSVVPPDESGMCPAVP